MRFWQGFGKRDLRLFDTRLFNYFYNTKSYKTSQLISTQTLGKLGQNSLYIHARVSTCFSIDTCTHLSYTRLSIYLHTFFYTRLSLYIMP